MPIEYTIAPASFMDLASLTAYEATPGLNSLKSVGVPSVKNTTIFLASERPDDMLVTRLMPSSALVAPAGLMAPT